VDLYSYKSLILAGYCMAGCRTVCTVCVRTLTMMVPMAHTYVYSMLTSLLTSTSIHYFVFKSVLAAM